METIGFLINVALASVAVYFFVASAAILQGMMFLASDRRSDDE
jgi:hypothetical protein